MHKRIAALATLAVGTCLTGAALAQQPPRPAERPQPLRLPTTWEKVEQPLDALLNDGWRIVAMTGPGFTLEKRGKYVLCQLLPAGGMSSRAETLSECHGLN
jgi:hypothetical protein